MTSNQHGPYIQGNTHDTMAGTEGCQAARWSQSHKTGPSSDCRLKLAYMKSDLLVNAHHNGALNTFSGLVLTARHTTKVGGAQRLLFIWGTKAKSMIRVKS